MGSTPCLSSIYEGGGVTAQDDLCATIFRILALEGSVKWKAVDTGGNGSMGHVRRDSSLRIWKAV